MKPTTLLLTFSNIHVLACSKNLITEQASVAK